MTRLPPCLESSAFIRFLVDRYIKSSTADRTADTTHAVHQLVHPALHDPRTRAAVAVPRDGPQHDHEQCPLPRDEATTC